VRHREIHFLQAELGGLNEFLEEIPVANVIERASLASRKREVEEILAANPLPAREPVEVVLRFRGKPVVDGYGIRADFGAAAVGAFEAAVAAVGSSQSTSLGSRGVLPNRDDYRLMITGTVPGSFGFELEEVGREDGSFPELSLVESAISQTRAILRALVGSDDELTDAIAGADPRALEAVRGFLKTLVDQEAVCDLAFRDEVFEFVDVEQIRRGRQRLSADNIHEEERELLGKFQGVLPKRRTFEFRVDEDDEVISGKVGAGIEDAGVINGLVDKPVRITVQIRRVGAGRPSYLLLSYWIDQGQDGA